MLLGGSRFLKPVIDSAHDLGYHVVTCDYLPNNSGHKLSDEYCNVSVIDRDAVLYAANKLGVQGIMSFATDPGVVTAAYVAEKLSLPTSPLKSVEILQSKDRFRYFLLDNGFRVPFFCVASTVRDAQFSVADQPYPMIIKPVDSAGSKGVVRLDSAVDIPPAFARALSQSRTGKVIIEQFLSPLNSPSDADSLSIDGRLVFTSFTGQLFDRKAPNPFAPCVYTVPSEIPHVAQTHFVSELQRMIHLLDMKSTLYNVETRVDNATKIPYFMEVSPRGGGNRLSEMARLASGVDIIRAAVRAAVGLPPEALPTPATDSYIAEVVLHSNRDGRFDSVLVDPLIADNNLIELDVWSQPGDSINAFSSAADAIGTAFFRFGSRDEMLDAVGAVDQWLHVNLTD